MYVLVNGEQREINDNTTLAQLVMQLDLAERRFAVEVNETLIPRSAHVEHVLAPNDRVEIVQAIGGG